MEKKSYRVSARVTKELKDTCVRLAEKRNMTESDFISGLIRQEDAISCINEFLNNIDNCDIKDGKLIVSKEEK